MAERFGVGALEINRASEAKPGELLTCLNSGLTAVMNPTTGKVMSYDYITRFKNTFEKFRTKMITDGTVGKIGKIDITDNPINILKNEKYKGDAKLQKTYHKDHLSKKKCTNHGEVDSY